MKRILVTGAGGSPATNFVRSLRAAKEKFYLVGTDTNPYYLERAETDAKYLVPPANDPDYIPVLNQIIKRERVTFAHAQNDVEVSFLSENRELLDVPLFMPDKETVEICQDKFRSYEKWKEAKLVVPTTIFLNTPADLKKAFTKLGKKIWVRATSGAGGRGSLPATDFKTAKAWIDFHDGWGWFTAAEFLSDQTITWMSLWKNGKLVVAQGRKRLYWELGKLSPSGVSGVTGTGLTVRDAKLDKIALAAIKAIDPKPNGLFAVDLTYNRRGVPNPTEINIGRFFTTHHFFTEAGLNMPYIYVRTAYDEKVPALSRKINPLQPDLLWIRGVDFEPILSHTKTIKRHEEKLRAAKKKIRR
jgi:carbamoyl-phosphate synthase large subunit